MPQHIAHSTLVMLCTMLTVTGFIIYSKVIFRKKRNRHDAYPVPYGDVDSQYKWIKALIDHKYQPEKDRSFQLTIRRYENRFIDDPSITDYVALLQEQIRSKSVFSTV